MVNVIHLSKLDLDLSQRIVDTLDIEIKRWAAGKEGNLRALLSTMQYVLWPECGWQPVSLTDLITGASVKKVYRKATLCIHPDKVQQKGANLQQKYIAEKVFDLLKVCFQYLHWVLFLFFFVLFFPVKNAYLHFIQVLSNIVKLEIILLVHL
ncbi:auxilin-related protein 2 [Phtheirospermum japonicum]|uniref:Auxilin-related protein 2 n=1 Tax=Phtheirospermum japonicum TaxID=374723 RepID=A0A830D7J8_9LAMI|nr:auxilin-related protein 2 [Phtheirospermum japonicum]